MDHAIPILRRAARRLTRDEGGSMTVFGLFLFLMMLMVGGMAVDLMRYETNRTRLQATLDRAILAAADLSQTVDIDADGSVDADEVVRDHFRAAGLLDQLGEVEVTETFNSRTVTATAAMEIDTFFMDLVGVETLAAPAAGAAEESVEDIEIVLVLDVSGSMIENGVQRLANLKVAARNFVQTVLENDSEERISIAIVPFNGQVNLGTTLRAAYNVSDIAGELYGSEYDFINCVDLPSSGPSNVYTIQTISRAASMPATALADSITLASSLVDQNRDRVPDAVPDSYSTIASNRPAPWNMWCPPLDREDNSTAGNVVRLPTRNLTDLQNNIDGLVGVGATSINAGMRWGMTLLDPAASPIFDELITAGQIPQIFDDRPYAYGQENTRKIIVLMTDGDHFSEERVNTGYRSGLSLIWRADTGGYSVFHESKVNSSTPTTVCNSRPFWVPHLGAWHSRPWNGTSPPATDCYVPSTTYSGTVQQRWPQVWSSVRISWVAWQLYARPLVTSTGITGTSRLAIYTAQMNLFRTRTPTEDMDVQLQQMCDRAEAEGVEVFGIAFEAPPGGKEQIEECARTETHGSSRYYEAQGSEINGVFHTIAIQINALRLTQ